MALVLFIAAAMSLAAVLYILTRNPERSPPSEASIENHRTVSLAEHIAGGFSGSRIEHVNGVDVVFIPGTGKPSSAETRADHPHRNGHLPEITWDHEFKPPELCRIEYEDAKGNRSERTVYMAKRGREPGGHEYVGVYDQGVFKTFRSDRIKEIEILN